MNDDTSVYEFPLQCRHTERDCVSTHRHLDFLFNRLFRRRPKKTSKLRVTSLCKGNSPRIFSIWWRHHALPQISGKWEYWKPRSPSLEEDAPGVLLCGRHVSPDVKIPVGVTTTSRVLEVSSCFFNVSGMSQNNFTVNLPFYPTLSEPINGLVSIWIPSFQVYKYNHLLYEDNSWWKYLYCEDDIVLLNVHLTWFNFKSLLWLKIRGFDSYMKRSK